MGKTWLLKEFARQISENKSSLVGYSNQVSTQSILRAISDCYESALSEKNFKAQLKKIFKQEKGNWIARYGRTIVNLCLFSNSLKTLAGEVLTDFESINQRLLTADLELERDEYEEVLRVVKLITETDSSNRSIILILDAVEVVENIEREFNILDRFIKNTDQWPHCHFIIAYKHPDNSPTANKLTHKWGIQLSTLRPPVSEDYELPKMHLENHPEEIKRLINYLHSNIKVTQQLTDDRLLEIIDGYPGVLEFWTSQERHKSIISIKELTSIAVNAKKRLYVEIIESMESLDDEERKLIIRVTFLPPISRESWHELKQIVLDELPEPTIDTLNRKRVLNGQPYPDFGHSDAQRACMTHFRESHNLRSTVCRELESLIFRAASSISYYMNSSSFKRDILLEIFTLTREFNISEEARAICFAATAYYDSFDEEFDNFHDITKILIRKYPEFRFYFCESLLNLGIKHLSREMVEESISDFTAVIEMPEFSERHHATALYARGIIYQQMNDDDEAALADFTKVIEMPEATAELRVRSMVNRGAINGQHGDTEAAIADFTTVIEMPGAPATHRSNAMGLRGGIYMLLGNNDLAIADYSTIIEMPEAQEEYRLQAFINRGFTYGRQGDNEAEIADYTTVIEMPEATTEQLAEAIIRRGVRYGQQGDIEAAIEDYTAIIEMPEATAEQRAIALVNRGVRYGQQGDNEAEIADYTKVIEMPEATVKQRADAYDRRGITYRQQGDNKSAIADFTMVIEMPDTPASSRAEALFDRGFTYGEQEDNDAAIADYTKVIEMLDAPIDTLNNALINRSHEFIQLGNMEDAIADCTKVISTPDVNTDKKTRALYNRGEALIRLSKNEAGCADLRNALRLHEEHGIKEGFDELKELIKKHCSKTNKKPSKRRKRKKDK